MNKSIKFGFAALAVAASLSVFAADVETENEYEAIGWTPIAVGVASPVQLPWGSHKWDVFGLDLNVIWTDAPKMYGLGIGGIAMATRDTLAGMQVSALCNWASADVCGMRATLGGNIAYGNVYGVEAGLFGYRTSEFWGWDTDFVGAYQPKFWGLQISGLANVATEQSYGCSIAALCNWATVDYGFDLSIFNYTTELHGCQVGVVNYAKECPWGFQLGLVNIIMDNSWKVLPLINCYF